MATIKSTNVFIPPPLDNTSCVYKKWCDVSGPGCVGSAKESCCIAQEIKYFETCYECSSLPRAHCDIPAVRIFAKKDTICGEPGKCKLADILKGLIPIQYFASTGDHPKNYDGTLEKKNLLRVLCEFDML